MSLHVNGTGISLFVMLGEIFKEMLSEVQLVFCLLFLGAILYPTIVFHKVPFFNEYYYGTFSGYFHCMNLHCALQISPKSQGCF